MQSWSSNEEIGAIVDGNKEGYDPYDMLDIHIVQVILVSFPRTTNQRQIK